MTFPLCEGHIFVGWRDECISEIASVAAGTATRDGEIPRELPCKER
jgi:hypothetical protein